MPLTATMVGAILGFGTQVYSNALRKLPIMRRNYPSPFSSSFFFQLTLRFFFSFGN